MLDAVTNLKQSISALSDGAPDKERLIEELINAEAISIHLKTVTDVLNAMKLQWGDIKTKPEYTNFTAKDRTDVEAAITKVTKFITDIKGLVEPGWGHDII